MYLHGRIRSFRYAFLGIKIAWKEEASFKLEVLFAILALILSWVLRISRIEFIFILLAIGLVFTAELLNTGLEEFCDMVKSEHDPHVAKIKDLAAGAVLIAVCIWAVVGIAIFIPHLLPLL